VIVSKVLKLSCGGAYSVKLPPVVTRPICPMLPSVNESAPSGPVVMASGPAFAIGIWYSVNVSAPAPGVRSALLTFVGGRAVAVADSVTWLTFAPV
jgi:hypothetical protein